MARSNTLLTLALVCLGTAGCGDDSSGEPTSSVMTADAATGADASVGDASDIDTTVDVPCDPTYPAYHEGMTQKAGDLTVKLLSVSPAPPRQQTPNNWALQVVNGDGTPATGFAVTSPDSFMVVHGHHGRQPPKVAMGSDGNFTLSTIDFFMRGPWRVTFSLTPTGGKEIITTFQVCVN